MNVSHQVNGKDDPLTPKVCEGFGYEANEQTLKKRSPKEHDLQEMQSLRRSEKC